MNILICSIENQQYAFDLAKIERIVLAVEVTPLPNSPEYIFGAINLNGQVIPVINLRSLLGLPLKTLEIKDHFILCHAHGNKIALWVDKVKKVKTCNETELIPAKESFSELKSVEYVLKDDDEITLFYDLEKLLPSQQLAAI